MKRVRRTRTMEKNGTTLDLLVAHDIVFVHVRKAGPTFLADMEEFSRTLAGCRVEMVDGMR